jgi:hypothetical protein
MRQVYLKTGPTLKSGICNLQNGYGRLAVPTFPPVGAYRPNGDLRLTSAEAGFGYRFTAVALGEDIFLADGTRARTL